MIERLAGFGYLAAAKAVMGLCGVEVGPPRLPHLPLPAADRDRLAAALDAAGFWDAVRP